MSKPTRITLIRLAVSILLILAILLYFKFAGAQTISNPAITDIQPPNAKINESITITGTNFGTSDATNFTQLGLLFTESETGITRRFGSVKTQVWTDNTIVFKLDSRTQLNNGTRYTIQVDNFGLDSNSYPYETGQYNIFLPSVSH